MKPNTHPSISPTWVGQADVLRPNEATAKLETREQMCADERGLVHGGFTFGLADYAAMLAVNDPHVVLGSSSCKFLAPVRLGQTMIAKAVVRTEKGKKRVVDVQVEVNEALVFDGEFTCFVLEQHVLG